MRDPIVILAASRTRSNMVAAMFAAHGVWWKAEDQKQLFATELPKESRYASFENVEIRNWHNSNSFKNKAGFRLMLEGMVPTDAPWFYKVGAHYGHLFHQFPDTKYIYVRRSMEGAVTSRVRKGHCNGDTRLNRDHVLKCYTVMRRSYRQHGGVWVDTDGVITGEMRTVREAFEYCGIPYDGTLARGAIKDYVPLSYLR